MATTSTRASSGPSRDMAWTHLAVQKKTILNQLATRKLRVSELTIDHFISTPVPLTPLPIITILSSQNIQIGALIQLAGTFRVNDNSINIKTPIASVPSTLAPVTERVSLSFVNIPVTGLALLNVDASGTIGMTLTGFGPVVAGDIVAFNIVYVAPKSIRKP